MDKSILIQYSDMKEEIKDLRRRIAADKIRIEKLEETIVADSVTCGKKGHKPIKTVKIQGYPIQERKRRIKLMERRILRLEKLETQLIELTSQVDEYIESIEKSELRIMFRYYFLDNLSYAKTAMKMNDLFPKRRTKYTDENIKKRIQRFFENVPQCPDNKM